MADERKTKVVTIATPEGAACYPFGSWGRGYILDAPARAGDGHVSAPDHLDHRAVFSRFQAALAMNSASII